MASARPPVADQIKDERSLLNHYKSLIELRGKTPALAGGDFEPLEGLVAFVRRYPSGDVLVLHNVSRQTTEVKLPPENATNARTLWASSPTMEPVSVKISLPPLSSIVLAY